MITFKTPTLHWNYFLAIEKDLENISRFIEFDKSNLNTFSIELTHILFSASSEVDVVIKQLCNLIDPHKNVKNIGDYKGFINTHLKDFIDEEVIIHRYGITCKPWEKWSEDLNPDWWRSYNNVKHKRNVHYTEANLNNAINAVGALLITVFYYYKQAFSNEAGKDIDFIDITGRLIPESSFIKINNDDYYHHPVFAAPFSDVEYKDITI
jgi:hypothetical protein